MASAPTLVVLFTVALAGLDAAAAAQFASDHDRRDAFVYYREGRDYMSAEQFALAANAFRRATEKDPLLTIAHCSLGEAYMALRQFASAVEAFTGCRYAHRTLHGLRERERFALERRRDEEIRELRETVRRMQTLNANRQYDLRIVRIQARIEDLERQRSSNGIVFITPSELSLALGSAYFRNDQFEDAEREWKAAVDVNPRFGEAHNNLAALYAITGRKQEAEAAVREAERAGFRVNPQLKEDIRRLPS